MVIHHLVALINQLRRRPAQLEHPRPHIIPRRHIHVPVMINRRRNHRHLPRKIRLPQHSTRLRIRPEHFLPDQLNHLTLPSMLRQNRRRILRLIRQILRLPHHFPRQLVQRHHRPLPAPRRADHPRPVHQHRLRKSPSLQLPAQILHQIHLPHHLPFLPLQTRQHPAPAQPVNMIPIHRRRHPRPVPPLIVIHPLVDHHRPLRLPARRIQRQHLLLTLKCPHRIQGPAHHRKPRITQPSLTAHPRLLRPRSTPIRQDRLVRRMIHPTRPAPLRPVRRSSNRYTEQQRQQKGRAFHKHSRVASHSTAPRPAVTRFSSVSAESLHTPHSLKSPSPPHPSHPHTAPATPSASADSSTPSPPRSRKSRAPGSPPAAATPHSPTPARPAPPPHTAHNSTPPQTRNSPPPPGHATPPASP